MKNKKIILIQFLALLFLASLQGFTQEKMMTQDSLMEYLKIAASNNPTVLQRFSEYRAALEKVPQAGALNDPEFNIGVFVQPMELVEGKQYADFQLMQMFPWFGTLKAAKDEMSLMAKARFEQFRDAKLQVFYDVQRTWYELYKISKQKEVSERNVELLKTIERLTLVKYKTTSTGSSGTTGGSGNNILAPSSSQNPSGSSGMQSMGGGTANNTSTSSNTSMQSGAMTTGDGGGSLSDLFRIQIEINDLSNNIASLGTLKTTVLARFNSYLNRVALTPVQIPDTLSADTLYAPLPLVPDSVLQNNPMLGMLSYEQQSLDARRRMANRMGYPMFGVGVDYSLIGKSEMSTSSMNGNDMIMPMVKLTLPVWRQKYAAQKKEAELLKIASAQNYNSTANSLQTEYYQALQQYQDSRRRAALYKNQLELSKRSLNIMMIGLSTSGTSLTDILRIRQQLLDYELKTIEADADLNTSIAWMKRIMAVSQPE